MTDEKDVVNDLFLEDWRNGTIRANNESFEKVNKFLKRCESVLRAENLCVGEYKMEKSKGKAHQLYVRACNALKIQLDTDYVNGSIIDNDNNNDDDV
ncbi:7846_t:CDS:2 [Entrophospora sp. SA101]|nr:7846_t:CDS:2 [Entrophospora sp. SA101]